MTDFCHVWLCEANYRDAEKLEGIPARPHVMAYQAPYSSLTVGGPVILPARATAIACTCELAVEIDCEVYEADEASAVAAIRGYRVLAAFRDESPFEEVILPTARDRGVCDYYARWGDTFNCVSELISADQVANLYDAGMSIQVTGYDAVHTSAADYLHRAPAAIAALSGFLTLQPGDIISLGRAGEMLRIPRDRRLPAGARVVAEIAGIGRMETEIIDNRRKN
jgi:2-keto-4-pentenoate hydratase/2-oxohepta-3-ene-1,7-dioic acid hydratase in catechol pathway